MFLKRLSTAQRSLQCIAIQNCFYPTVCFSLWERRQIFFRVLLLSSWPKAVSKFFIMLWSIFPFNVSVKLKTETYIFCCSFSSASLANIISCSLSMSALVMSEESIPFTFLTILPSCWASSSLKVFNIAIKNLKN